MGSLARRLNLLAYGAGSLLHWKPRERAVAEALDLLTSGGRAVDARVVDVGCGLGQLAPVARDRGLRYLGLDPDSARLDHCRRRYEGPHVSFDSRSAKETDAVLSADDIVVLNGVAHHLADEQLWPLVEASRASYGLIITDHWRKPAETPFLSRLLQRLDRGAWVRDYDAFDDIEGFDLVSSEVFPIGPLGARLWLYFCNGYRPRAAAAGVVPHG